MADEVWFYLQNPFDNNTKKSFSSMNLLATDHHDKLKHSGLQNPAIMALYNDLLPAYTHFKKAYTKILTNAGRYQARTKRVEELVLELSSTHIRRWDVKAQNEYDEDSIEYKSILPDGRAPYQSGAYEKRVNELKALVQRISDYPALSALQHDVELFVTTLENARTEQQGYEQEERQLSQELEQARQELATVLYGVFVRLKYIHLYDLKMVETYYELQYLRRSSSETVEEIPEEELNSDDFMDSDM